MFKLNKQFIIVAGVLLVALATTAAPALTAANSAAVLRPDPVSLGLKPGDQGSIAIRADAVQNMYGVEFHLTFDPNIVQVVDADASKPGVQLQPGDFLQGGFAAVNKADNVAGTIDYAATLLNPAPPQSGGGVIATITFKAKANGTSPLKVTKAIFATRKAEEIKSEWQDGAIGVSPLGGAPNVQVTTSQPGGGETTSPGLPFREIALIGVAGVGVLGFLGAIVLVLAIVVLRRRR